MQGTDTSHRRPDIAAAATLSLVALISVAVLKLGSEIAEGETAAFDRGLLVWMRAHLGGVPGLRGAMLDFTALGDATTLCFVALAVAGALALGGRSAQALFLLCQAAAGAALLHALKPWFGRARPDVVVHWAPFDGKSFPSGHSADSAIVYLSLALIASRVAPTRTFRMYLFAIATTATVLVGFSRVFLGVHWPTDVIAGWAFGGGWAVLSGTVDDRIACVRRPKVG